MTSFTTGFVIFPNLTQLDFTGPPQASIGCRTLSPISRPNPRIPCRPIVA
jgi:hypothetical protein